MNNPKFPPITNVFVLMLENHSFDNLLGFSGIIGTDAVTGAARSIEGLKGDEFNVYTNENFQVQMGAPFSMPEDPGHEFPDTLMQLTGTSISSYDPAKGYPPINNGGFALDYAKSAKGAPQDIMRCFSPQQLPVLNALAKEFAVCDKWFSSLPGPTCPNRLFVHAASSAGLDHSPDTGQIAKWEALAGIDFEHGTIFDQLKTGFDDGYRLYSSRNGFPTDIFPNVAQLKGIKVTEVSSLDDFANDISNVSYDWPYTFIEPSYGNVIGNTFKGGNSMHSMDDVTHGEALIKQVYEALRKSPLWLKSLLIIIWDEHGGFYDHVPPPKAPAPGDRILDSSMSQFRFDFTHYGVRVPAVIVSPLIPKNTIDGRLYDHASVPKTLQDIFPKLSPMTARDRNANSLKPLLSLPAPRTDAPMTLPDPATSGLMATMVVPAENMALPVNKGSLPMFLHAALRADLDASPPEQKLAIHEEFRSISSRADAERYIKKVQAKIGQ